MNDWEIFYKTSDGNNYPHPSLIVFFYKYVYKLKKKKINILDLGCGGGLTCEPLTRLKANVTGIDFIKENHWYCRTA